VKETIGIPVLLSQYKSKIRAKYKNYTLVFEESEILTLSAE